RRLDGRHPRAPWQGPGLGSAAGAVPQVDGHDRAAVGRGRRGQADEEAVELAVVAHAARVCGTGAACPTLLRLDLPGLQLVAGGDDEVRLAVDLDGREAGDRGSDVEVL